VTSLFGKLADGTEVHRWSLENGGTRLKVLDWGGVVQGLEIPDFSRERIDKSVFELQEERDAVSNLGLV